jgi:hypothetical protein
VFLCHPLFFWKQKHACNAAVVLFQAQMYPFSCTHIMLRNSFSSMRALVSKKAYAALYFNAASISSLNLTWNQLSSWFSFKHTHSCLEKRLRSTCLLFRRSFYIFLQLNVGSIKLIRNAFGNKTYLRVFVSPTPPLKQKHACNAAVIFFQARNASVSKKDCDGSDHVFYFSVVSVSSCNSTLSQSGCLMHVGFVI